jgi:hypothetical protein
MPPSPRVVTVDVTGDVRALVPEQREPEEPGVVPGMLAAMAREAERLAELDPPFTDTTRIRLREILSSR